MKNMIDMVRGLRLVVSEPVRAVVAQRMADMVAKAMPEDSKAVWASGGRASFLRDCGVPLERAYVPDDYEIEPTAAATFLAKWNSITKYKVDGEWVDFTQEMDSLRRTMLEELVELGSEVVWLAVADGEVEAGFTTKEAAKKYASESPTWVDIQACYVEG